MVWSLSFWRNLTYQGRRELWLQLFWVRTQIGRKKKNFKKLKLYLQPHGKRSPCTQVHSYTLKELFYPYAQSSGLPSHGQFNLGLLRLSPQDSRLSTHLKTFTSQICILSRYAIKERKTYTMKNSAHKALEGEPRQGKPDVQGWCFPGQNPGDVSIAPVSCTSFLSGCRAGRLGLCKRVLKAWGLRLIYRAQFTSMPCLAISAGTGLPACTCVDSPVKYSFVPALGSVPNSQATDMAGQVLPHCPNGLHGEHRQTMGEGTASAMRSLSFKIFCNLISLFIFGCAGSSLLHWLFSCCHEWEPLSSCCVWASHCGGFSCGGAQAPEHRPDSCGSELICSAAHGIFLDRGLNLCLLYWQVDSSSLSHQVFFFEVGLGHLFLE